MVHHHHNHHGGHHNNHHGGHHNNHHNHNHHNHHNHHLPAYGAIHHGHHGSHPVHTPPVLIVGPDHHHHHHRHRGCCASLCLWITLLFGAFFVTSSGFAASSALGGQQPWVTTVTRRFNSYQSSDSPWEYQIPTNVHLASCTSSDRWKPLAPRDNRYLTAQTYFDLPLTSQALYFLARGDMSGGSSRVVVDPRMRRDRVGVSVVVHYTEAYLRDLVKVCVVSRVAEESGVGIFTPHYRDGWPRNSHMRFETIISLPSSASDYVIKNFETDLPNTQHDLYNLAPYFFRHVALQGTNAAISAAALHFYEASIRSSNSPVTGVFNTTGSLVIQTSNSNVQVDVGATASREITPNVVISTTNSPLRADISLFSPTHLGSYEVTTSTTNSPLSVSFLTQPVDGVVHFTGSTTNSPAEVSLHPLFEGAFDLHSSAYPPAVKYDTRIMDPSGRGRKRWVGVRSGKRDVSGEAGWGEGRGRGSATIRTTNGVASLSL